MGPENHTVAKKKHTFYVWKQKIGLILTYREEDEAVLKLNIQYSNAREFKKWFQFYNLTGNIILLSLSDYILEHLRGVSTSKKVRHNF